MAVYHAWRCSYKCDRNRSDTLRYHTKCDANFHDFFFPYNRSQSFGIALPSFEFQISSSFEIRWKYSERRYWKAKLLFRDVILLCLFSFSLLIALTFSNWVSNLTTFLYIVFSEVTPKYCVIFFLFFIVRTKIYYAFVKI